MPIKLDNKAIADLAHEHKIPYICDRTIGTPILEKPIVTAGVDVVIHSLSKNIAGHSAGLGGAIIAKKDLIQQIYDGWFVVLLAFGIKGKLDDARKVVEAYKLIVFAPHLGDIRTLSIHPASTTH